jgi:hypothetical protein
VVARYRRLDADMRLPTVARLRVVYFAAADSEQV